jgi:cytochrome c-type biogenesis protein CcmF
VTRFVGQLAILLALATSAAGALLAFAAARGARSLFPARRAAGALLALVALAVLAMEYALLRHDFSVQYVTQVGSLETPVFYTIISLWSALEGSILLWALILAVYTAALAQWQRRQPDAGVATGGGYTLGTLFVVNVFFLLLLAWPANPFGLVSPAPMNGPGPNPLLQNHPFMGVHPPLLYLGYVGLAVPFAFAMGALFSGQLGPAWPRAIRRWTLVPWGFLSLGIVAGAWWSYEVLGWGGYWAWDPVENASFMPWLTATAFLHSVMVAERREMLKTWTLSLVIATFLLTLLGTFLTRSGVIASVHAFTQSLIGPFFLAFFGVTLLVALGLLAARAETLRAPAQLDSPLARESAFLANNLLFVAFTFVVLLGTMYPLIAEAARGVKVSVGAPYFNRMNVPLALALVLLSGLGPALPWRRGSPRAVLAKLRWPAVGAVVVGIVCAAVGVRAFGAWITIVLAAMAVGLLVEETIGPARARARAHGEHPFAAVRGSVLANPRRYGGYIAHFGVLVAAVGIAVSASYRREREWTLRPGQSAVYGRYAIQLDSVWALEEPHRDAVIAGVHAFRDGQPLARLYPRLNYYRNSNQPIATPAVREGAEDLYLVLSAYAEDGSTATVKAIITPLVTWIWCGGIILAAGVVFALVPARVARR